MQVTRWIAIGGLLSSLLGCANLVAPPYSPDYETLDRLKAAAVGKLQVAPTRPTEPAAPVNRITLRGASMASPAGTFTKYLEQALIRDLQEIGALDAAASTRLDSLVLKNDIDVSGLSTGTGVMEVEIGITRSGVTRLKKTYLANTRFESSFAAAVAVPKGQNEYANLVRALLKQVYADPEFINAIRP